MKSIFNWLFNKAPVWKITRYGYACFECERQNLVTGEYQHRHYTNTDRSWKDGPNPYRDNIDLEKERSWYESPTIGGDPYQAAEIKRIEEKRKSKRAKA